MPLSTPKPTHRHGTPWMVFALTFAGFFLLLGFASADVLITVDGQRIETQGPWQRIDEHLVYTDADGERQSIHLERVDLEASREMTAEANGTPYQAPAPPLSTSVPREHSASTGTHYQFANVDDRSPIILYETTWCGYCRKARRLLKQLDAEFEAKDVERDREAAVQAQRIGGRGVPVLDFAGVVVRGYDDRQIRSLVRSMRDQGLLDAR